MSLVPMLHHSATNQRSAFSTMDILQNFEDGAEKTNKLGSPVYSPHNYHFNTNYDREFGSLLKSKGASCLDALE